MTDNQAEQSNEQVGTTAAKRSTGIAVAIIVLVVIIALVWWVWPTGQDKQPESSNSVASESASSSVADESSIDSMAQAEPAEPEPMPEPKPEPTLEAEPEPEPEPQPEPEPKPELPALNESTPTVLQTLDSNGVAIQPLKSSQLVRDAVVIVDNLRNGTLVRDRTIVQRPDGRFSVIEVDGQLYIDEQSYQRYDGLVDWFVSLDEEAVVESFATFNPLLQEAYGEIGYPDTEFSSALIEAIDVLLATPVPETLVAVKDDEVMYTYANPAYEALPPAQKQLLRMGPDNIERVKQKLLQIKRVFQANL